MKTPMISVIMPVYDAEKYVAEAIESILSQTYSDFEFIIIDDCSTDGSYQVLEQYKKKDKRIILLRNDVNSKLPKTLNLGIAQATGKYIARMDADDISLPERFAKQIEFMENNPHIGVCGTYALAFGNSSGLMKVQLEHTLIKTFTLFVCNNMIHPSTMLRKDIFDLYDIWYDENLGGLAEDYDLWIRMLFKDIKFANLAIPLLKYRILSTQTTNVRAEELAIFSQQLIINHLKFLYGKQFTPQIVNEHKHYIQQHNILKKIYNYYGFCQYKKKFLEANAVSKILTLEEANCFLTRIDVVKQLINRLVK